MKSKSGLTRLLLVAYFIEAGVLLIVVPWSTFWERNYFVDAWPPIETIIRNYYVRGAVSGLGLVNVCAGLLELSGLFSLRRA